MTNKQLAEARRLAESWARRDDNSMVTRERAINEERMALDVIDLIAEVERLTKERDEWKRRYDNAPAQEAYEAVRAELEELQLSDSTAAQKYEAAVDDNLPRYGIGTDCHGEPDEANYVERIEYAGEEIKELKRAERRARDLLTDCARKLRLLVRDYPGDKESRALIEEIAKK